MKLKSIQFTVSVLASMSTVAMAASVPNRLIIKFKDGTTSLQRLGENSFQSRNRDLGVSSPSLVMSHGLSVVRYSTGLTPKEAAAVVAQDPTVEWAQPDYIMSILPVRAEGEALSLSSGLESLARSTFAAAKPIATDPTPQSAPPLPSPGVTDPRLNETWGLDKISAASAWKLQGGTLSTLVADIDTGIDYNHEDLMNNLWSGIGYDFVNNDNLPYDDHMHGTHTAGTIGAVGMNGKGVSGVSPRVTIMGLKFINGQTGEGTTTDAIRAIDYAIAHGARVLSNSWGGPAEDAQENKALEDAVERAGQANVLFVAAAGNDSSDNDAVPTYPAAIKKPNILTVASTSPKDALSVFSNYGLTTVHVAAPGSGILSTVPGNGYSKISGTSMACPHVAGLAALILSENPKLTAVQVKQIIMDTVDRLPELQGKTVTGGRINAAAAIEKARTFAGL
ncbi:MAG: S8 family serine peptidase [Bdellovibrionales bacterium]|nr:S8 family serine peptidase [Bdellovibrionales bacterium]